MHSSAILSTRSNTSSHHEHEGTHVNVPIFALHNAQYTHRSMTKMKRPSAMMIHVVLLLISVAILLATGSMADDEEEAVWPDQIPKVELVVKLSEIAQQVYDVDSIDSENIPDDVYPEFFKKSEHAEVLVGTFPLEVNEVANSHIFVAMRGTDEGKDWSVNGDFGMDPMGPSGKPLLGKASRVRVHSGFNEASFEIFDDVDYVLQQVIAREISRSNDVDALPPLAEVDGKPIVYFTGHSKGGAESQILATYLAHLNPDVNVQLISYGAPQVGNDAYKRWAEGLPNLCSTRFVLKDDLVPRLPPSWANYAKYGHLLQMQREGITAYWRQDGGGSFSGVGSSWNFGMSISNHMMWRYVEFLEELMIDPHIQYPSHFEGESSATSTALAASEPKPPKPEMGRSVANKCQKCTWWIFCSPC